VKRFSYLRPNGVQLINENDRRSLLFGQGKRISDQFSAITNEHLDNQILLFFIDPKTFTFPFIAPIFVKL
jgi:hypothetical protein